MLSTHVAANATISKSSFDKYVKTVMPAMYQSDIARVVYV
jgi:hypothetical protein